MIDNLIFERMSAMVRLLMCVGLVMTVGAGAFAATKEDAAVKSIADDNNVFAAELYARLSAGGGNLFFSPHSIHTARKEGKEEGKRSKGYCQAAKKKGGLRRESL